MSFDLIIANPPYGKRGTLATTLIKEFMKFAEECIVLCQPRSIEKNGVYEHVVKADIVDNIFDAGLGKLAVSKIRNDYTEGKQVLYGKREIQETDITFQIRKFNDSRLDRVAGAVTVHDRNPVKSTIIKLSNLKSNICFLYFSFTVKYLLSFCVTIPYFRNC